MTYTFDSAVVSDLHKDAYGFRPAQDFWVEWNCADNDARQKIWDDLLCALQHAMDVEREAEKQAIARFETRLANLMHSGTTRERVIAALVDAEDCAGDMEYFCFRMGLPYHYFQSAA